MYKALIIDDEEPTREAIRILGDWPRHGIGEVLEAADGQEGLALLERERPDLVLVDMKMPVMDGLAFLQVVERDYPDLFTIVISGYNDFDYTRQAIRARVVDYLLKPVNRGDLNQALAKAAGVLDARRDAKRGNIDRDIALNMSLPKLKENIYLSLLARTFRAGSSEAYLRLIGADDPGTRFGVTVLRLLNLDAVAAGRFKGETALLHYAAANVVGEFAEAGFQSFGLANPKRDRELIVIHAMTGGYPEDLAFRAAHFARKIAQGLHDLFGLRTAAGLSGPGVAVGGLADAYDAASEAADGVDLFRGDALQPAGAERKDAGSERREMGAERKDAGAERREMGAERKDAGAERKEAGAERKEAGAPAVSFAVRMPQLRAAIEAGSAAQARTVVQQLLGGVRDRGRFSLKQADRLLEELLFLLGEVALELGLPAAGTEGRGGSGGDGGAAAVAGIRGDGPLGALGLSADYAGFDEYEMLLCGICERYADLARAALSPERAFDVGEIKRYIEQHYFEDIKISMFTERYFLSREYLMKLFKQHYGYGIHEYVQKVRMDKAKALLDRPELKIQEISEMLGFKDKNYFSKAFRNYVGLSPTEYRAQGAGAP
ncbi:response regulator transcription factor [Cohnella rhizosphaerae]|uniref:Response regulator n=1 Tax=Cohnella rhizosphaerae TaxID=1457232 RepID=A0A9X4L136_9BACL|nr:response regulator [Cohnella rhizosphaerae]MDG0811554.1 response regulator [Cohnella rhizosphaerae]